MKHYIHELNVKKFNYLFRKTLPFRKWYRGCIALDPYIFGDIAVARYPYIFGDIAVARYGDLKADSFVRENKDVLFSQSFMPEWVDMGEKIIQYRNCYGPPHDRNTNQTIKVIIKLYKDVFIKVETLNPMPNSNGWFII